MIVFGKVLSPQFMIWLCPCSCRSPGGKRGLAATGLLARIALAATQQWFLNHYYDYIDNGELAWLVFTRDLILVAILALLALPGPRGTAPVTVSLPRKPREVAEVGPGTMA